MHIDTMRRIDRWAGIPLTFLLTRLITLRDRVRRPATRAPRNVLCIELSEMGATILAEPAMRKLRDRLGCELHFVIFAKNRPSLDILASVPADHVFTLREHGLLPLLTDTLRFLRWTRRRHIDTVIDLELFSRCTALLAGASGAAIRVGFDNFHGEGLYRGGLLTHRVLYNPHLHIAKNFVSLVNALLPGENTLPAAKMEVNDEEIRLPLVASAPEERALVRQSIHARAPFYDPGHHRLVLINPNASELLPQRRWMPERYVELIRRIVAEDDDLLVLVTGAPAEREEAEAMCARTGSDRCVNFAGALTLQQLPALYTLARLMVTNDSGPGHFAAVTRMPTFVLFGPETPALYGPLGNTTPIFAGLACSPCVSAANHRKTPCVDNRCLQAITVDQVFALVRPLLTASPA
ncbi:MAG: glycosyltransferase family 9 protein [Desulfobulbus sp.]|nr:glycosyltransferase family 9 protein [Desulfobulbus sp.]